MLALQRAAIGGGLWVRPGRSVMITSALCSELGGPSCVCGRAVGSMGESMGGSMSVVCSWRLLASQRYHRGISSARKATSGLSRPGHRQHALLVGACLVVWFSPADGLARGLSGAEMQGASAPSSASKDSGGELEATDEAAFSGITQRSVAAQARFDAGDFDGAISLWSELLEEVLRTPEQAPRRASFLLAIVDAHEQAYIAGGDPRRLRVAIELLDRYLGELAPTDDENRVVVEARRASIARILEGIPSERESGAADDVGPMETPPDPRIRQLAALRWTIAGAVLIGTGVGGAGLMAAGMGLGVRADRVLEEALTASLVDPMREAAKREALASGVRANRLAYAGGIVGAIAVAGGLVALVRGRRLRLSRGPVALGAGVWGRF